MIVVAPLRVVAVGALAAAPLPREIRREAQKAAVRASTRRRWRAVRRGTTAQDGGRGGRVLTVDVW